MVPGLFFTVLWEGILTIPLAVVIVILSVLLSMQLSIHLYSTYLLCYSRTK